MTKQINVIEDFHPFPAGRYLVDGDGNGTRFREDFLLPHLKAGEEVIIDLDGAPGYPSSFLEEAFGGLVRASMSPDMIRELLRFHASKGYQRYVTRIWEFIDQAAANKAKGGQIAG
ncbi:hypothetical protein ALP8811_03113 [Aliiroseovarius pelagivivens]|uniref:DUF4325 domain-containing protein n=1 Tax=Aliiroseovarius pelagivivens TaxID=1639690 RepID=A0A2R8AT11_9RHOB|nr:STAS-like domain-containing protein [Aliiroseovarius pelagivivens]SPF79175.1 hypothetical protein ALP8811_03113 [Aliiroseovarius pelagivivens]